jgi:Cu(I)/Ag(I) efflux system periplasmic protein CusF
VKSIALALLIAAVLAGNSALAAEHGHDQDGATRPPSAQPEYTRGEVQRVNREGERVTVKHEAIRNLDMPAHTMVLRVKEPAMLDRMKPGDRIEFVAEKLNGAIVITDVKPAKRLP